MDIFEIGYADIYDHIKSVGASIAGVNTFFESWLVYLEHEKEEYKYPDPFIVADRLREINRNQTDIGDDAGQ